MGPCGIKCYATNEPIPVMCENVDLRSLAHSEVEAANASFIRPIVLRNFGRCKRKIRVGATSEQELDLDRDGVIDIRLSWTCVDKSLDGSSSRSILTSYSEEEVAKWGPWSCWTVCKATCWGGLQTRVRKCLHGRPGLKGCAGEGSQKRDCYFGRKCNFRIRKNVRSLTEEEIKDLIQAMRNFKRDSTANGFHSSASMHSWPNVCNGKPCRPTGGKMDFLAWQRLFLLQMELGLNKYLKDKTLGIPYWNWLDDDGNIPDILWNKKMHKRINPFINMTVILNDKEPRKTIKRSKKIFSPAIELARAMWDNVTRHLAKPHIMREFSKSLENIMEIVYLAACEEWSDNCEISLANLKFSAFDPLYMFIHSNADRLWAIAQKKMEESGSTTWSSQTALDALDKEGYFGRKLAPFANESVSGHKLLQSINSLRDSYYYQKLMGVKYDHLSNDGFPTDEDDQFDEVGGKALRTGGEERLFIGHYFKNVRKNVYINYYLGDDETPCRDRKVEGKVGSTVLLSTDIVYKNTIPTLLPVETVVRSRLSEDFNVKACYTYEANCTEMCREARGINVMTMPDPMLIYHVKDHPIDIYKFNWSNGRRMANWLINLEAGSHWIYFYGDRARNIVQVPTVSEWISCNRKRGRPVACGRQKGNVCMLPVGIYFLIDGDEDHCRNGLKTVVVTRK
uniref:hemocyanin G-type, units Oda to Odg-like isoform X1 n=1 Tax=Styela clava TaxID=7725 RepID=UPI00193A16EF|nr:hemocyanin G-type, units Oda to Odg-like isoform X1 [Styela clava]